ncbi:methyl-accepting chemotaxis protein [Pseudomonas gingeri]|uniref:Methyl-accepting chemotaxis protein n=2 Tax=Pseudomonas gingeri TaxID=117681 RepID=A0A7Y7XHP2_9PSED|nr:methyl-accepting chemotaxis protein [Pseudomonas gingeri]NWB99771.1 methyl-accepting chemotaxis protein [Pseudomonas gingeri]
MSNVFFRVIGNMSVNLKLGLGFGLVLLLTAGITAVGWLSMGSLIDRGEKLKAISSVGDSLRELRINRQNFETSKGSGGAESVTSTLSGLGQKLGNARAMLSAPADIQLVASQVEVLDEYKREFERSVNALQARNDAFMQLRTAANVAVQMGAEVERSVLASGEISRYRDIVEQNKLIQNARFQVRGYIYNSVPDAAAAQAATEAIDQSLSSLLDLYAKLPKEYGAHLQKAAESLKTYRSALIKFKDSHEASKKSLYRMEVQGTRLLELSDQLAASQSSKRDADTREAKLTISIAAVLAIFFGVVAAWVITRQIVVPLRETLQAANRVASGDLSHNLEIGRHDEIGQLQQSMQHMTVSLRELIGGISDGVIQIASAAEELSAVTEQTSAGVNSQKIETDQVATAMQEMTATVQEVARNAEDASASAHVADSQAQEGDAVVKEVISQIEHLAAEMLNSNDAMAHLKQESDKIGGVLDVIKSVAQQTNLLALNAAIEAARAGEAGRGFAVVADEVRSLAQRTQKSTEEIELLIAGLQSGTSQVATIMGNSLNLTDSSVALTRKAGDSLSAITKTVSAIQAMNLQIAAAAEQQSAVAEEINRSVLNVRDVSEQTSAASEETARSSIELARLGTHLQSMVGRFRL